LELEEAFKVMDSNRSHVTDEETDPEGETSPVDPTLPFHPEPHFELNDCFKEGN
jgi:hypothetical protein